MLEFDRSTNINKIDSGYVIESKFPLVDDVDKLISIIGENKGLATAIYIDYILELPLAITGNQSVNRKIANNQNLTSDPMVLKYLIRIALLDPQFGKYQNLLRTTEARIKEAFGRLESFASDKENRISSIVDGVEASLQELSEKKTEFFDLARSELDAVKASAIEIRNLNHALAIWNRKRCWNYIVGVVGWIFLAMAVSCPVYLAYLNPSVLRDFVIDPLKSSNGYGLISIYLIPVIAIGWVLRILGRLVNSSFILADDASQRKALLETYYRLVADQEAKMQQGDRILILNALFRPLPGHQHEDISPPTLADLVGDALKGKKE